MKVNFWYNCKNNFFVYILFEWICKSMPNIILLKYKFGIPKMKKLLFWILYSLGHGFYYYF